MIPVLRSELINVRMAGGNEKKYSRVIIDNWLKEWVGIGGVSLRKATERDKGVYPTAVDKLP